jgi:hypothetical protein
LSPPIACCQNKLNPYYRSEIEGLKLDFDEYLRENPNSEIIGELNRANAVLQDFRHKHHKFA